MIVLDTNVVSEVMRVDPDPRVIRWFEAQDSDDLYISAPVVAELRQGIERLAVSRARDHLERGFARMIEQYFDQRILPFDTAAAIAFGTIVVSRSSKGHPIEALDAMIAAIARVHASPLATRNLRDFAELNLQLINPFEAT